MNLITIQDFFADYSVSSVVMAGLIFTVIYFLDKINLSKSFRRILFLLPFALGILFSFVYNLILTKNAEFTLEVIYAGLISGSLSVIIKVTITKIIKGEPLPKTKAQLLITGLIEGYVKKESITIVIQFIENLFVEIETSNLTENQVIEQIANELKKHTTSVLKEGDLITLASLIYTTVLQTKE